MKAKQRSIPIIKDTSKTDFTYNGPLYSQVRDRIVDRLAKGIWQPGMILPTEPDLAKEFGVSLGTLRRALDTLARDNLVVRQQGKGTFVAENPSQRTLFHFFYLVGDDGIRHLPTSRVIHSQRRRATGEERERLELPQSANVIRIERVREIEGQPVIVETLRFPAHIFPDLDKQPTKELPNTLYQHIEHHYSIIVHKAMERLKAIAVSPEDAVLLGIEPGTPLQLIDRIALTPDDVPIEWRSSRCNTDHYYCKTTRL